MGNLLFSLRMFMASIHEETAIVRKKIPQSPSAFSCLASAFTAEVKLNATDRGGIGVHVSMYR